MSDALSDRAAGSVYYHGTANAFERFDASRFGSGVGYDDLGSGVYLTTDRDGWAAHFAREAAAIRALRVADQNPDGVVLAVRLRPGVRLLDLDHDVWEPERGRELLRRLGMESSRPELLASLDAAELADPRRVVLDLARYSGATDTSPALRAMGYDGLVVREPRWAEGFAVDPDARTAVVFDPDCAIPDPIPLRPGTGRQAEADDAMPFDRWPTPAILFRGTEPGDAISTLRFFREGDLGDAFYLTPKWWLAATYGGGPRASLRSGTRVVHAYELDRHVGPGDVAYLVGGASAGDTARLVSGVGYTVWTGLWSGRSAEAANRDAMGRAARAEGVKLIIGRPDSVGINQVAVLERDVLTPILMETVVARAFASFAAGDRSLEARYELWDMVRQTALDGRALAPAIKAAFERLDTPLPKMATPGLTPEFAHRPENARRWAELGRESYGYRHVTLGRVVDDLARLVAPAAAAAARGKTLSRTWRAEKGWTAARPGRAASRRADRADDIGPELSL